MLRNTAIVCFILGTSLQIYSYQNFKRFYWSLVKQKIDLTKIGSHTFELLPNLDTTHELVLFYKKLNLKEGEILDPDLALTAHVNLKNSNPSELLWKHQFTPSSQYSLSLKGIEKTLGSFELKKGQKYILNLDVKSPTSIKGTDVVISVVVNQKLFKKYFSEFGKYEIGSYIFLISSFLFFIGFIIGPRKKDIVTGPV